MRDSVARIWLFLRPVFITLLSLELILRLIGAYYMSSLSSLYDYDDINDKYKISILAVGESTTGGLWYEDRSYPIQLRTKLNEYYGCDRCVNLQILALPGANTSNTLKAYISELATQNPDIVIFMVGVNDGGYFAYNFDALLLKKDYQGNKLLHDLDRLLIELSNKSKLAKLLKLAYSSLVIPEEELSDRKYIYGRLNDQELSKRDHFARIYVQESDEVTEKNLESLIKVTRATKAIPVLMTYHEAEINHVIRKVAETTQTELIDNEKVFEMIDRRLYISDRDDWHPNAEGYEIMATSVMDFLIKKNLIPSP